MSFSWGSLAPCPGLPDTAEKASVSPPALPVYIRKIRIILDAIPSSGVMPSVSPTVPMADAVSKRHVSSG